MIMLIMMISRILKSMSARIDHVTGCSLLMLILMQTSCSHASLSNNIWWNLGSREPVMEHSQSGLYVLGGAADALVHEMSPLCAGLHGLSPGQRRFCRLYTDHMASVSRAVRLAVDECQRQFRFRRWNCSTVAVQTGNSSVTSSLFGHVTDIASRETAFTYATLAAGVVHAVSRSCRDGELRACGCARRHAPRQFPRDWVWGGCGDNVDYGYRFAQGFVDIREREMNHPRRSRQLAVMLMNVHNNEAGRKAVFKRTSVKCKCHGVSGSCNVRTCWYQLPAFSETGDRLKERYDAASRVKFNRQGTALVAANRRFKRPTTEDLVFFESSPDYCEANAETGALGTSGRECQRSSPGTEGCGLLCCGRGYNVRLSQATERCHCRFQWCCYVRCKTCEKFVDVYTCK